MENTRPSQTPGDAASFITEALRSTEAEAVVPCGHVGRASLKRLEDHGLRLTEGDKAVLAEQHREALRETKRVEFDGSSLDLLIEAFADSPFLIQENLLKTLTRLVQIFWEARDELPADIPDDDLLAEMRQNFDRLEGAAEELSPEDTVRAIRKREEPDESAEEPYSITDDDGRRYVWNPNDWEYDEFAKGWDGESWSDDF